MFVCLFLNRKSETCLLLGRKQKTRVFLASSQFPLGSRPEGVIANALFPLVLCKVKFIDMVLKEF